jgi:hypothetical protein
MGHHELRWGCACAGIATALSGCPNPNTYTTPRTLDPGKVQWQLAPEVIGLTYKASNGSTDANGNPIKTNVSAAWPMIPTFGMRIGVANGWEIGLRLPNGEPFGGDVKIRLRKGSFDVALDPGVQAYYASTNGTGFAAFYLHAPILLGINFSEKVSLVLSPGLAYAASSASGSALTPQGAAGASTAEGLMARLGVGFDFRVGQRFSLHPEVTVMRQFTGGEDLLLCVGGLGLNFGARPDYSDLASPSESPAEPEPPPPPAKPAPPVEVEVQ